MMTQSSPETPGWVQVSKATAARLEQRHPLYDQNREVWELYEAIFAGRLPDRLQKKFLPRGRTEEEKLYELRLLLSQWTPESQTLVRRVLNHVFRDPPDRFLGDNPLLNGFMTRACSDGKGIDELMLRATNVALTFGMALIAIDMRERPEALNAQSREDESAAGLHLPYGIVATPLDVPDWDVDDQEELTYLKLVTHPHRLRKSGERLQLTRYTEYTRENWSRTDVVERDGRKWMRRHAGEHGLGRVPVVQHAYESIAPMVGRSYVELAARVDVDIYQTESDRAYDRYDKAHPLLVIKSDDDLDKVYGKNFVVKLRPGEDAGYASSDSRVFESIESHIERRQKDLYRFGHIEPPVGKQTVESGLARLMAQEDEGRLYASVADQAERAETEVWELAARWLAGERSQHPHERAFTGYVRYPDRFNVLSSHELAGLTKELLDLGAPSVVIREIKKQLWTQVLGSVAPEVLNEAASATEEDDVHLTVKQRIDVARLAADLHQAGVLSEEDVNQAFARFGSSGKTL